MTRDPTASGPLDLVGGGLVTLALACLCFGLIEASGRGWSSPVVVGCLAAGAALTAVFVLWERRAPRSLLPLSLLASRQFVAVNAVTFVVYAALGGALFLLPIHLQQVSRYSPLQSGAALLPVTVIMLTLSARSGALAARIGPRFQMTLGPLLVAAGMALFVRIGPAGRYLTEVLPAVAVFGLGLAATVAPLTATALGAAPPERAGLASAVNNNVARAGSLLAIAVLPVAAGLRGAAYLDPEAFAAGFRSACLLAAAVCASGGLLAAATIRREPPTQPSTRAEPYHCGLDATPLRRGRDLPRRGDPRQRQRPRSPDLRGAERRCLELDRGGSDDRGFGHSVTHQRSALPLSGVALPSRSR